jgi:hypothetical protein
MGQSGVLLGAGDPADRWAGAIEAILADPGRLEAAALANARRAEFSMPFVAAQYLGLASAPAGTDVNGEPGATAREFGAIAPPA